MNAGTGKAIRRAPTRGTRYAGCRYGERDKTERRDGESDTPDADTGNAMRRNADTVKAMRRMPTR